MRREQKTRERQTAFGRRVHHAQPATHRGEDDERRGSQHEPCRRNRQRTAADERETREDRSGADRQLRQRDDHARAATVRSMALTTCRRASISPTQPMRICSSVSTATPLPSRDSPRFTRIG